MVTEMNKLFPEIEVDLRVLMANTAYKAKAKICLCPFCRNLDPDKERCTMCEGSGIIIKLHKPPPELKLVVIPGGKI